jgi:hypothetical protein
MKLEFCRQIFKKYSNVKIHENPSCESKIVACGRRGMTKLIVAFRKFCVIAPTNRIAPCNIYKFHVPEMEHSYST